MIDISTREGVFDGILNPVMDEVFGFVGFGVFVFAGVKINLDIFAVWFDGDIFDIDFFTRREFGFVG